LLDRITIRVVLIRTLLGGGRWAVGQTIAATGAFMLKDFVHVMDVLHFRMHRALETGSRQRPQAMQRRSSILIFILQAALLGSSRRRVFRSGDGVLPPGRFRDFQTKYSSVRFEFNDNKDPPQPDADSLNLKVSFSLTGEGKGEGDDDGTSRTV
jgi:hypothetical protein